MNNITILEWLFIIALTVVAVTAALLVEQAIYSL